MPDLSGPDLVKQLVPRQPTLKVLYISGYMDSAIAHQGVLEPGTALLKKPFSPDSLTHKVREVLETSSMAP
jgi:DNA-binding NtrC family response regulator